MRYNEVSTNLKLRGLLPSRSAATPQSSFHSLRGTPAACHLLAAARSRSGSDNRTGLSFTPLAPLRYLPREAYKQKFGGRMVRTRPHRSNVFFQPLPFFAYFSPENAYLKIFRFFQIRKFYGKRAVFPNSFLFGRTVHPSSPNKNVTIVFDTQNLV